MNDPEHGQSDAWARACRRGEKLCDCAIMRGMQEVRGLAWRRVGNLILCGEPAAVEVDHDVGKTNFMCAFHYEQAQQRGEPTLEEVLAASGWIQVKRLPTKQ